MKLQDALKLHNEDEVTVKATKQTMQVVEIEVTPREKTQRAGRIRPFEAALRRMTAAIHKYYITHERRKQCHLQTKSDPHLSMT